jgi:hypothetical protein
MKLDKGAAVEKLVVPRKYFQAAITALETSTQTCATKSVIGDAYEVWAQHEAFFNQIPECLEAVTHASAEWSKLIDRHEREEILTAKTNLAKAGARPNLSCLMRVTDSTTIAATLTIGTPMPTLAPVPSTDDPTVKRKPAPPAPSAPKTQIPPTAPLPKSN